MATRRAMHRSWKDLDLADPLKGTLHLVCPVCRAEFTVPAAEVLAPATTTVQWSSGFGSLGQLEFTITAVVEHTCPEGTVIKSKERHERHQR